MSIFQFKQFTIDQTGAAMKIGTDSMILGAWAPIGDAESILDIGTGTGLLALMLAQRSDAMTIDAVEIDDQAYESAVENFENSPWGDRLFCYHASVQEFAEEIDDTYDFIIANPPYFDPNTIESVNARSVARQTHLLNHVTLLKSTKRLLNQNGECAFSLPYDSEKMFVSLAENLGFNIYEVLRMKDQSDKSFTRSFIHLGFKSKQTQFFELTLKNVDNTYTEEFKTLTKDFYLNF